MGQGKGKGEGEGEWERGEGREGGKGEGRGRGGKGTFSITYKKTPLPPSLVSMQLSMLLSYKNKSWVSMLLVTLNRSIVFHKKFALTKMEIFTKNYIRNIVHSPNYPPKVIENVSQHLSKPLFFFFLVVLA